MLRIIYQILGFRWCAAIMIEHEGINDQIQLQHGINDLRHKCLLGICHLRPIIDAQLCYLIGYTIGKFGKAYKYGGDTACNFNQTNVKCPAYDTTKCNLGHKRMVI